MPPIIARKEARTNDISLYARGRSPSTSTRSSFSRIACQTRPGDDSTAQRTMKNDGEVAEREPVQVLRVDARPNVASSTAASEASSAARVGLPVRAYSNPPRSPPTPSWANVELA